MSAIGNVVIAIKAVDEASSVMDALKVGLSGLSTTVGQISPQLGSLMQGFAAGGPIGLAVAGIGQLVGGLQDCVKAAIDSEQVWSRLKETVSRTGYTWEEVGGKIESAITGLMNVSRYSDEKLASAMKTLMQYGMGVDEAMTALADTMDLATAKQVDLESAATAVGKAFQGNTGVLERMGVVVADSKDSAVKFASAMGSIRESFGGAAQADITSYAGKWAQFTNKWDELMEKIGKGLLPVLTKMLDVFIVIVDGVSGFVESMQRILGGFYDWLVGGSFVQNMVDLVLNLATGGLNSLLKMVMGNLDGIISTLSDWGKTALDIFNNLWNGMVDSAIGAFNKICDVVKSGINAVTGFFNNLWTSLTKGSIWIDMWNDLIAQASQGMMRINSIVGPGLARMSTSVKESRIDWDALARALDAGPYVRMNEYLQGLTEGAQTSTEVVAILKEQFDQGTITAESLTEGLSDMGIQLSDLSEETVKVGTSAQQMSNTFNSIWPAMQSIADSSMDHIVAGFRRRALEMQDVAQRLKDAISSHSIWPDMWKEMISQTASGFDRIMSETRRGVGDFESLFAGTASGLYPSTSRASGSAAGSAASTGPTHMTVTIPITVQHMTGEVKDLEKLARVVSRELGSTVKWRT